MYTPTCPTCTHLGSENCPHFKGRLKMHCGWDHKFILEGGVRYGRFNWTLKFLFIYLFIYLVTHKTLYNMNKSC